MNALVLIAEDEPEIVEILDAYLVREGFRTARARDGRVALDLHAALKPDLVLLDVGMPKVDGWTVLAELRRRGQTPVIMITALDQDIDKLQALRIGADDYVVKPFNPVEVAARAKAVLRRTIGDAAAKVLRIAELEIDMESYEARYAGAGGWISLPLTLTEFRILAYMARSPTRVFSRSELADACLGGREVMERTVDSHLSKLRKKLETAGAEGVLHGVRGVGYRLGTGG